MSKVRSPGCAGAEMIMFPVIESPPHWKRHLVHPVERIRTTWKLRLALLTLLFATVWLTSPWWTAAVARSLVCDTSHASSDAILIENFDPDYLLFERASQLRRRRFAKRIFVPIRIDPRTSKPNAVSLGIAEVMARISELGGFDVIGTREMEPITLNAARDIRSYFRQEHIRSAIIVTPLFRSRRSALVYEATLGRDGVALRCEPVEGSPGVTTWTGSWHGIQNVTEQWLKLQYYRAYVLPFVTSSWLGTPNE